MSKVFDLVGFADHLLMAAAKERLALAAGLERVAAGIEKKAKEKIGHYQEDSGMFPGWEPLAQSTEDEKARLGYPLDAPLLRDGELRDSIKHEVHELEAVIGSESDIAVYQEFGTSTIPPRPFIGPAAFESEEKIKNVLVAATVMGIMGGMQMHPSLGYDLKAMD